jgi:hypothetical protein
MELAIGDAMREDERSAFVNGLGKQSEDFTFPAARSSAALVERDRTEDWDITDESSLPERFIGASLRTPDDEACGEALRASACAGSL